VQPYKDGDVVRYVERFTASHLEDGQPTLLLYSGGVPSEMAVIECESWFAPFLLLAGKFGSAFGALGILRLVGDSADTALQHRFPWVRRHRRRILLAFVCAASVAAACVPAWYAIDDIRINQQRMVQWVYEINMNYTQLGAALGAYFLPLCVFAVANFCCCCCSCCVRAREAKDKSRPAATELDIQKLHFRHTRQPLLEGSRAAGDGVAALPPQGDISL